MLQGHREGSMKSNANRRRVVKVGGREKRGRMKKRCGGHEEAGDRAALSEGNKERERLRESTYT